MGGFGAFFDMGRYWQVYNVLLPWNMNFNSVMLEVGLCVFTYILVLMIEFAPAFLERWGMQDARRKLEGYLFFFIALGMVLPTMHQSSLGSLLIVLGHKVTPLWQSGYMLPLLALLTALTMGFSITIFEAALSSVSFRRPMETPLLSGLAKIIVAMLAGYLVLRFGELAINGKLGMAFSGDFYSMMFLLETALFVVPLVIMLMHRDNARMLLVGAVCMLFGGALYRFNGFIIGFDPGEGYTYFPSAPEIMVTLGIVAIEIMIYLWFVKRLPVLHRVEHA
jgi:Ni/Fe-hydrogenase subunit HybB-like protein